MIARVPVATSVPVPVVIKTNSTEYAGSDVTLGTSYAAALGTVHTTNPNTGLAWTIADLDALQVGTRTRS